MSQGYQIYPQKCYKTPEHLFRLSPSPPTFPPLPRAFPSLFRNFVGKIV